MKINIGAGGDIKQGWKNVDIMFPPPDYCDITKPLDFPDCSADIIYSSHTLEHVSAPVGLRFLKECYRVLKPNGLIRICVPSISRIVNYADKKYLDWLGSSGFGEPNMRSAIENLIANHGHLATFSEATLSSTLYAAGFQLITTHETNQSNYNQLRGLETHGQVIGEHNNWVESICAEAIKQ